MLVADIDHFKQINDKHGHQKGDEVLRAMGELLRAQSRKGDVVARFGGEEFVVLLPNCSPKDAVAKAEDLRRRVAMQDVGGVRLTVSIGVACVEPGCAESLDGLFVRADAALYEAKRQGRDRVILDTSVREV